MKKLFKLIFNLLMFVLKNILLPFTIYMSIVYLLDVLNVLFVYAFPTMSSFAPTKDVKVVNAVESMLKMNFTVFFVVVGTILVFAKFSFRERIGKIRIAKKVFYTTSENCEYSFNSSNICYLRI